MADSDDDRTLTKPVIDLLAGHGRLSASVMVLTGTSMGKVVRLVKPEMVMGRSVDADIFIDSDSISRRHAKLVTSPEGIDLVDLGSKNGTRLNGEPMHGTRRLASGDRLQLGSETILRFTFLDLLDEAVQRELYDSAIRDGLTGAFNRKFLDESLEKEFAFCARHAAPISVLMMDVDHFKRLNDTFGHAAGDFALRKLVEYVHGAIRTEDVFARYGGEEFTLILREVPEDVAVAVAERLRLQVANLELAFERELLHFTISIGVATQSPGRFSSALELEVAADKYLLQAKLEGRNCVRSSKDAARPSAKR